MLRRRRGSRRPTRLLRGQAAGRTARFLQRRGRDRRVMEILTPGDSFEGYFDAYEEIVSRQMGDEEHRKERAELGKRYGITWHDENIPEVEALFGIGS